MGSRLSPVIAILVIVSCVALTFSTTVIIVGETAKMLLLLLLLMKPSIIVGTERVHHVRGQLHMQVRLVSGEHVGHVGHLHLERRKVSVTTLLREGQFAVGYRQRPVASKI